jgi:uncharacterized protein (DUF58 family)
VARSRAVLTPRGWGLVAGGLGAVVIGYLALNVLPLLLGVFLLAFAAVDLVAFGLVTAEFDAEAFRAQRSENTSQVAVGGVGTMALRLESSRRFGFYAEVSDRVPEEFRRVAGSPQLVTWWEPGRPLSLAYAYQPLRRGGYEIGPTSIVAHDAFGLAFRVASLETPWPVDVLPQVALWRSEITTRLKSEMLGQVLVHRQGFGTEFRSLREYRNEDDFRSIVWKRSTFERLFVKESEVENRNEIVLLLDVTRPMAIGLPGSDALDQAVDAALLVARYAFSQGDRVAVLLHAERPLGYLPLGGRLEHSFEVDRLLGRAAVVPGEFRLGAALDHLVDKLPRPSTVLAFTALEPLPEAPAAAYRRFRAAGHRLYAFVPDPLGQLPLPEDPFRKETLVFATGPEEERRTRAVERARSAGVRVSLYDRRNLFDQVTARYARLRTGVWE